MTGPEIGPEQAKAMAGMMLEEATEEAKTTRKILAAIPENKTEFKLGEKGWTAATLAWHIVTSEMWFAQGLLDGKFGEENPPEAPKTVAEIVKVFDTELPALCDKVGKMTPQQLVKPLNFFNMFNMPAVMYMRFWISHSIHHRGYLAAYLRAMNAHVPAIYGGSADEPFQMPAESPAAAGA